ncbi:MAG TPA: ATP-binding protein [Terrimicrobiaceae bacterium]
MSIVTLLGSAVSGWRGEGSAVVRFLLRGFAVLAAATAMAWGEEPPRVLMLFSNDRLLPANQRFDEGIRRALDPQGNQSSVTFFGEFLDSIRLGGPEREAAMEEYLKKRYRDMPPHVLVALGPQALNFFLARRDSLFPGAPLVFGGVSHGRLEQTRGLAGVAGLPMELTVTPTVEALIAMRPQTREILLVHGTSDFDRSWRDIALRQCAAFGDRVKVTDFPELALEELKSRLGQLSQETAVLYLTYFQGPTGETYTPARVAKEIATASAVPVMGPYDTYVGSGVLGVSVSPFEEEGVVLGKLIRRVISGEKPESIGILPPNSTRLILDDRQVKRWGIKSPPAGAELRFHTPTLWEQHRALVIATIGVVALQGLMIAGLVVARTRQKRAEKELRLSEARFSGVFRGSPAAISIIRQSDGRIVDVNPGWEATTGVPRADAVGRTPIETGMVIDGDAENRLRQFLESGKPLHDYEQVLQTPDGRTRWLSLSTELITLHDEPCYVVVAKDVTENREGEEALRQLAHTSRLAMLGEMTASIAHEVNQPLGAILSNTDAAEMLLEHAAPPLGEVRRILSDIRRDDIRASAVITRVRALVGRREVRRMPLDLNGVLLESLKLVTHDARRRGVSLIHELADDLPEIRADTVQVEQVLLNLLLNAMDAMKDTPVAFRRLVVRSFSKNGDSVEAIVEDSGHGIPPEKLGRIFDSFFTTKEGGMGLGLALARSIAEAHGGYLFAENNASTGATFHLILPVNFSSSNDGNDHGNSGRPSDR